MPITFRKIHWLNFGNGVVAYPLVKDASSGNAVWDPRSDGHEYWCMTEGREHTCDIGADRDCNDQVLANRFKSPVKIGFNIVWGDDVWCNDKEFQYDANSNVTITFRKYGGTRNGDCGYDGETV